MERSSTSSHEEEAGQFLIYFSRLGKTKKTSEIIGQVFRA
jgi:hypothetical protein